MVDVKYALCKIWFMQNKLYVKYGLSKIWLM